MLQRKKDLLMTMLEQFFQKLAELLNRIKENPEEAKELLSDSFDFYEKQFSVTKQDSFDSVLKKLPMKEFVEGYATILVKGYELGTGNKDDLNLSLNLITYLQDTDTTFSWERMTLHQDILRLLNET